MIAIDGSQIQINSLNVTLTASSVKGVVAMSGETRIGRKGKKYRASLNGARSATPKP